MDYKRFVKIIFKATGSKNKTKNIMINCYKNIVLTKKFTLDQISKDLQNFLNWLKVVKNINIKPIIDYLKKLDINRNVTIETVRDKINIIFERNLGDLNIKYRMEYNVLKLLQWINRTQGIDVTNIKIELKKYLEDLEDLDIDSIFDNINLIFNKYLPNDYENYEGKFQKIELKRVENRIRQSNIPKFEIIDKYNISGGVGGIKRIKVNNNKIKDIKYNVELIGGDKEGRKLAKVDKMIQGGLETTLKNDFHNLELISSSFADEETIYKIKDIWENNVYKYLQSNKLKPRTQNRIELQIFTVFLILDKSYEEIVKSAETKLDINIDSNKYAISMITKMIGSSNGYMNIYKIKLKEYLNPKIELTKVVNFLKSNNVKNIDNLISEIYDNMGVNPTERKRNESVYLVLKNAGLKKYDIKITRSLVVSLF